VNERYALYVLALVFDIGVWSPRRSWLYYSITAAVIAYLATNNPALVDFAGTAFPQAIPVNQFLDNSLGSVRVALLGLCSLA